MKIGKSIVLLLFIIALNPLYAQKNNARSADDAFNNNKYVLAIERYRKAYTKIKDNIGEKNRINFQLGECYRLTNNIRRTEIQFKRLIRVNYQEKEPLILLYLADALRSAKKYTEALPHYQAFAEIMPDDPRGLNGVESCTTVQSWEENPTKHIITNLKKINSKDDDFSATYANNTFNTIVFTSSREKATGIGKDEWTNQSFSDLFLTRIDRQGNYGIPVLFDNEDGSLSSEFSINTSGNEGTPVMNDAFTSLYFTRCPTIKNKESQGCNIYMTNRNGSRWSKPQQVRIGNNELSVVGHPTLSKNELKIYFSAEGTNGFGAKDIWMASRESKTAAFGRAQNLGAKINTPGDEMFPSIRNDSILYFSSNGHVGMGGLDIFRSTFQSNNWTEARNLKFPMNSSSDDFSLIFHPEKEEGFFTSNRKGGRKDDIYSFYIPILEFSISGRVKNDNTLLYVKDATIELKGSDGTSLSTRTNSIGKYEFGSSQIKKNVAYTMVVKIDDFFNENAMVSTSDLDQSEKFVQDFLMRPIPSEPVVLPDILYDLGSWELKIQYQDSLQDLIKTLDENENLVIELASHTDSRDTDERNDILSQRRARSVVDYLILRGIDPDRLVAKGYGERQARELKKHFSRANISFETGTVFTEEFIDALPTTAQKEAAHELNRRTEFRILNKDFIPKTTKINLDTEAVRVSLNEVVNEISFTINEKTGDIESQCQVNGNTLTFAYRENASTEISLRQALRLLNKGEINKNDFSGDVELSLADGTIANGSIINIKKFGIAGKELENLKIVVNKDLKNQFLIGKSVLQRLSSFTIDNEAKKIIFN